MGHFKFFFSLQVTILFFIVAKDVIAEDLSNINYETEIFITQSLCDDLNEENIRILSNIDIVSGQGLTCISKILSTLSTKTLLSDTYILSASKHLWNLVEHAELVPPSRHEIRVLLEAIRKDILHPLRSEAWLGLILLDRLDQRISYIPGKLPYIYVPSSHLISLLPLTKEGLKKKYEKAHPRFILEIAWMLAQIKREQINNPFLLSTNSSFLSLLELNNSLISYEGIESEFLSIFLDTIFQDKIISTTFITSNPIPSESDILPAMTFSLTGSVCAAKKACKPFNINASNLMNINFDEINENVSDAVYSFDSDPSWSMINIPYLQSLQQQPESGGLINYSAYIQSYIRGGYWKEYFQLTSIIRETGNETASVNYLLKGVAVIPQCSDTTQCSVIVDLFSRASLSNSSKGTSVALEIIGPDGKKELSFNNTFGHQINRSIGEHKIEITLQRIASHTGSCCHEWLPQDFSISLVVPGALPPKPKETTSPTKVETLQIVGWEDQNLAQDLQPFKFIGMQLENKIFSRLSRSDVIFSNYLGKPSSVYERRHGALWSRLIFSRLALEWLADELSPTEKSDLITLNKSLSNLLRNNLTGALKAEIQAYGYAHESLNPTPILLVMAALLKNTDLEERLNIAEANIVARIAESKSSLVSEQLQQAKDAINSIRSESSSIDALIRLAEIRYEMSRRSSFVQKKYERLARELSQLWETQ